jgi:hypothetical protein
MNVGLSCSAHAVLEAGVICKAADQQVNILLELTLRDGTDRPYKLQGSVRPARGAALPLTLATLSQYWQDQSEIRFHFNFDLSNEEALTITTRCTQARGAIPPTKCVGEYLLKSSGLKRTGHILCEMD